MFGLNNVFKGSSLNRSTASHPADVEGNRYSSTPIFDESGNMTTITKCFQCSQAFKPVSTKDPTLQCVSCSFCAEWICMNCFDPKCTTPTQLSTLLKLLSSEKIDVHCGLCVKPNLLDLSASLKRANSQIDKLTATVADLQEQVKGTPVVAGGGGVISADIQQMIVETVARVVPQAMADFWENHQSRQNAKKAMVVSGLVASDIKSDQSLVAESLLPELQVNAADVNIKSIFRMGKGKKQGDKFLPPLLKVVFEDSDQRNSVLKSAKNLKDSTTLEGVFLRPSLTSQQRGVNQKLLHQRFLLKKTGRKLQVRYSDDGDPYLWDSIAKQSINTNLPLDQGNNDGINANETGGSAPSHSSFH